MDYSLRYFSDFWRFLKMTVTQKIELGINSNLLQRLSTSICIRKCKVILEPFFEKKPWAIALRNFQKLARVLKWS